MSQPTLKTHTTEMHTENGMLDGEKAKVADVLRTALADTFSLMVKTQGVHWNVQGPLFYSIHKLTEEQYSEMFATIDELAERIRALGLLAPQNVAEMVEAATLNKNEESDVLQDRIEMLISGNEQIAKNLRAAAESVEALRDVKSADIIAERVGVHEQNAWMLRSTVS